MSMKRIIYRPRADATPERERSALAECYRIILEAHDASKSTESEGRDEGTVEDSRGLPTGVNAD